MSFRVQSPREHQLYHNNTYRTLFAPQHNGRRDQQTHHPRHGSQPRHRISSCSSARLNWEIPCSPLRSRSVQGTEGCRSYRERKRRSAPARRRLRRIYQGCRRYRREEIRPFRYRESISKHTLNDVSPDAIISHIARQQRRRQRQPSRQQKPARTIPRRVQYQRLRPSSRDGRFPPSAQKIHGGGRETHRLRLFPDGLVNVVDGPRRHHWAKFARLS